MRRDPRDPRKIAREALKEYERCKADPTAWGYQRNIWCGADAPAHAWMRQIDARTALLAVLKVALEDIAR